MTDINPKTLGERLRKIKRRIGELEEERKKIESLLIENMETRDANSMETEGYKYTIVRTCPYSGISQKFLREKLTEYFLDCNVSGNPIDIFKFIVNSRVRGKTFTSIKISPS